MSARLNLVFLRALVLMLAVGALTSVALTNTASAMCPLCTAGAAIGLSIARYYGADDTIIGLLLGALAISTAFWLNNVIKKRIRHVIPLQEPLIIIAIIASTIVPFYYAGFFNGMKGMVDTIFGINRLAFGTVVGGIATYAAVPLSALIKKRTGHIPFQGVIITFSLLIALSVFFWYLTTYFTIV